MTDEYRAYGKLRNIIERRGGTMIYQREEFQYGAWIITLDSQSATIKATGKRTFPKLDRLYVPKIVEPKTWDDRHDVLLDDAEEYLLALLTEYQ